MTIGFWIIPLLFSLPFLWKMRPGPPPRDFSESFKIFLLVPVFLIWFIYFVVT